MAADITPVKMVSTDSGGITTKVPMTEDFSLKTLTTAYKTIDFTKVKDHRAYLIVENTSATDDANVVIKKGNAYAGMNDWTIAVGKGTFKMIEMPTATVKNVSGTDKGYVSVKASAASTLTCQLVVGR